MVYINRISSSFGRADPAKRFPKVLLFFTADGVVIMSDSPRNHHFIPQFYQKGFINGPEGLIWVYEKGKSPRRVSIRRAGMEVDLYGFTNQQNQFDTQTIEGLLAGLEDKAAQVIKRLRKGVLPDDLERRHLSRFISVMSKRTPKHKAKVQKMAGEMMPGFFNDHDERWLYDVIRRRVKSEAEAERQYEEQQVELQRLREQYSREVPDFLFPGNALRGSVFEQVLLGMDWAFFRSSSDTEFLTSDNPVAFSHGTGLKDREAVIMFPLSRELFLQAMWISDYRNDFVELPDSKIRLLNRYIVQNAQRQVYASRNSITVASFVNKWIDTY